MVELVIFFQLLMGHAIGDFVLQPGPMSSGKNRNNDLREQYGEGFPQWYYWLGAHSLTHAAIVFMITNNPLFAVIEAVSHWIIDDLKCVNRINPHQDQALHMSLKVLYVLVIAFN